MKDDRLTQIENAILANARAIGSLAHSLKKTADPVQGDPIDHLQDQIDSLESVVNELSSVVNELSNDLNAYPSQSAIGYVARMVREVVILMNYEILDLKDLESQFGPAMTPALDHCLGAMIEDSKPHPENRIDEFDRRLRAIEEKLSQ